MERRQRPVLAPRVSTSRSTRMTAPTRVDHSVQMAAGAASNDGDAALLLPVAPLITAADMSGTAVVQRAFAC